MRHKEKKSEPVRSKKRSKLIERTSSIMRTIRRQLNISQISFARQLDVPQASVWQWENGVSAPCDKNVSKIEKFCLKKGITFYPNEFFY